METTPVQNVRDVYNLVGDLSMSEKWLLFKNLQENMRKNEKYLIKYYEDANDPEKIKSLLLSKKESAIEEILTLLPFLNPNETQARIVYLRILPVFFSYVSLYDMRVVETFKIIDILKVHPAFADYQNIFEQWYTVLDRRRSSKKRFSYKDETYVRGLPQIILNNQNDRFQNCIGYANISLLRAFHRWLRLHRLHKYLFFIANLTYEEILQISESDIDFYANELDVMKLTMGARNKIIREIEILRQRQRCLESIIEIRLTTVQEVELSIREIKKILRTPICMNCKVNESIPALLVNALNKVFNVLNIHLGTGEEVIPVYGLLISVLKEAWNYAIFSPLDKELFNQWRQMLSDNLNNNSQVKEYQIVQETKEFPLKSPDPKCNFIPFDPVAISDESLTFGPSFYQCLEEVATSSAEYVLW